MAVKHYDHATELVMSAQEQADVDAGLKKIRDTILRHGFAQEAVDALSFKVTKYSLTINDDEARSGAFHVHAGGKPFYAINLSAPGSMLELSDSGNPTAQPPRAQALLLGFELGMNVMSNMQKALEFYGEKDDRAAGGLSSEIMNCNMETTMRIEPKRYFDVMNEMVGMRLGQIAPVITIAKKTSPGSSFRP
jgi:hypothetical protein